MALAALIFASQPVEGDEATPRAALPLAGATLLEHQVRRAVRSGAGHIIVLAERLPALLIAAIARLRRDGIRVDIARSVADASDRVHPDETLLLLADGCIADAAAFDRMLAARAPAVLSLPDGPGMDDYERLDATTRWAGLALVEGRRLHETAARLGDWDLALTLLRRALQAGAPMVGADESPIFARRAVDLASLEQRIIAGSAGYREGWPARLIFPWVERLMIARLVRARIEPLLVKLVALLLAVVAIPLAAWGGFAPALAALVASGPIDSVARRLADVRMTRLRQEKRLGQARILAATAAFLVLAIRRGDDGQWGWPLLGVAVIGVMAALASEWRTAHRLDNRAVMPFMATPDGLIWMFLPFGAAGYWGTGLMAALLYAVTSFVVAQRMVHEAILLKLRDTQV